MSYCKINIGGKERGLKFNQMAIMILSEKTDKEHPMATAGYALVYAGLKANAYTKGEEFTATFEDVCEWVEDVTVEDMNIVNAAFMETQQYKAGVAFQAEQEAAKKKVKPALAGKSTKNKR